ncbi:MAG TPA: PKD domain-containing protein [Chitinophaga sp.]|uniref:PKD domain-containing protein n=1 Tax=Chitinophaga sp. TaxID=1869181 RepID=UPI002B9F7DE9|nr:PKD domain-containing protein [Chitinophaga sp.]HVI47068.1 PKD domain-containing protein [Chitinophaga sp.]
MNRFLSAILLLLCSCGKNNSELGDLIPPAQPVLNIAVAGKDATHPEGDGSGAVAVTINSAHAFNYRIEFGDGQTASVSTNNTFTHLYKHTGVRRFTITATASGRAGVSSTGTAEVSVYRKFEPNPELVAMLTGNGTRKWRVDKDAPGHLGVSDISVFTPAWWSAAPNDKDGLGIYDDVYTFTKDGNVFTHQTNNSLFGKKEYLKDFDPSLTGEGDYTLTGTAAADYTETFGYDGNDKDEFIVFSRKGHLGMYFGVHRYQILERTDKQMTLRCEQAPGAWYVKIIAIQ